MVVTTIDGRNTNNLKVTFLNNVCIERCYIFLSNLLHKFILVAAVVMKIQKCYTTEVTKFQKCHQHKFFNKDFWPMHNSFTLIIPRYRSILWLIATSS